MSTPMVVDEKATRVARANQKAGVRTVAEIFGMAPETAKALGLGQRQERWRPAARKKAQLGRRVNHRVARLARKKRQRRHKRAHA